MASFPALIAKYIDSFNENDDKRRLRLIGELYTDDAQYTDPQAELMGPEQINAFIAAVRQQFPGYLFALASAIDAHHNQAGFAWHATPFGSAEPAFVGFDVLVADDGRVRSVYGFLDQVPEG